MGRLDFSNFEVLKNPYQSKEAHEFSEPAHARKLQLKKKFLFNLKSNYSSLSLRFSKTKIASHFSEKTIFASYFDENTFYHIYPLRNEI